MTDPLKLTKAINEFLLVNSPAEVSDVLQRSLFLLEEETISNILDLAMDYERAGNETVAVEFRRIAEKLSALRLVADDSPPIEEKVVGAVKEIAGWFVSARRYLASQQDDLFQKIIESLDLETQPNLVFVIEELSKNYDLERYALAETEIRNLLGEGSEEEALTLSLLKFEFRLKGIEKTIHFLPIEMQFQIWQTGIDDCIQAIAASDKLNDEACRALFLGYAGGFSYNIKKFKQAEEFYSAAVEIYRKLSVAASLDLKSLLAKSLLNLGIIQRNLRQLAQAKALVFEALEIYENLVDAAPGVYETDFARAMGSAANLQTNLRELEAAKKSNEKALAIYRKLLCKYPEDYKLEVAVTLNNLGNSQSDLQEFAAAEKSYLEALEIYQALAKNPVQGYNEIFIPQTLANLGNVHTYQQEFYQAKRFCVEAVAAYRKLAQSYAAGFEPLLAKTLNNLGGVQGYLYESESAEKAFAEALEIYQRLAVDEPHVYLPEIAQTLINLGHIQIHFGKPELAKRFLVEALENYRRLAQIEPQIFSFFTATTLNNLGGVQNSLGEREAAEQSFLEALEIYWKLARNEPRVYDANAAMVLDNLGRVLIDKKDFQKAIGYFEEARKITEELLKNSQDIELRKKNFQENLNVYRGLLVCHAKLGDWKKALEIAEQGKSRSLTDLLNLKIVRPKIDENLSPVEKAELKNLAAEYAAFSQKAQQLERLLLALYQKQNELPDDTGDGEIEQIRRSLERQINEKEFELSQARNGRERTLTGIRKYDSNFPPRTELLSHEDILEVSEKSGKAIVIFRATNYGTYVFIIFPDGTTEHLEIEKFTAERLAELITKSGELTDERGEKVFRRVDGWLYHYEQFRATLAELFESEKSKYDLRKRAAYDEAFAELKRNWSDVLQTLYSELVGRVHAALREKTQYKDVLFVPNGALAILPLHACWWEENGERKYLLDDLTISYATSVSVFKHALGIEQERRREDKFLFVTNPDESLRFSDREVDAISAIFSGAAKNDLRRSAASRETVIWEMAGGGYSQLHFSCHGSYDWSDPFASQLTMADGSLTVAEIMQINVNRAWLVTLSACETGIVDFRDASDEHYGFPLGFIFAGCPSVWGSFWSVDDEKTSELMQSAYEFIKKGKSKAEALRQAQIAFRKKYAGLAKEGAVDYSSPYYWAAFQHYGV